MSNLGSTASSRINVPQLVEIADDIKARITDPTTMVVTRYIWKSALRSKKIIPPLIAIAVAFGAVLEPRPSVPGNAPSHDPARYVVTGLALLSFAFVVWLASAVVRSIDGTEAKLVGATSTDGYLLPVAQFIAAAPVGAAVGLISMIVPIPFGRYPAFFGPGDWLCGLALWIGLSLIAATLAVATSWPLVRTATWSAVFAGGIAGVSILAADHVGPLALLLAPIKPMARSAHSTGDLSSFIGILGWIVMAAVWCVGMLFGAWYLERRVRRFR